MKKLLLFFVATLSLIGSAMATEVTTVSTAGTPLTLAQLKALSGTGGHVAFANLGSSPWTDKWLAYGNGDASLTLSTLQLYTITTGGVSGKYYMQRVSDSQYRTNAGWGNLASAENIEFKVYTGGLTVACDNPISIHDNSGTQWNLNANKFGGMLNGWAAFAAYGPYYILDVTGINDENSETLFTSTQIVTDGHSFDIPVYPGMKLKDGSPASIAIDGADAVFELHYEASTYDYDVVITGDELPIGTEITIKGDAVADGDDVSYATAVEESDIEVSYPSGYEYMTYNTTIDGTTITIKCLDTRWPVNFDKFTLRSTHLSRYTDKVGLNDQSITFAGAVGDLIYRDITNQKIFILTAGSTVTPLIGYRGWAMYGYLYIDYNNDGDFTDDGELVSQLPGNTWTGGDTSDKTIPNFVLTSTPGDYRIRFKIEWDNTNPGGGSQIAEHGGCIIDATLKVIASPFFRLYVEDESKYLQGDGSLTYSDATGKTSIWYYDGTKLYNFSGNYNSAAQFSNAASADHYNITAGEALGKSFSIVEDVDALPVSISAAGYATLYSPVALTIPNGVDEVYTASDEGKYLHLEAIEGQTIPANTGVIIAGDEGSYNFYLTDDVTPISSDLTGSIASIARPEGSYILATGSAGVGFYKDGATTIPGFKAYLPAGGGDVSVKAFFFDDETAIKAIEAFMNPNKVVYDMNGRRVLNPSKGLYIVNGKKVVIK